MFQSISDINPKGISVFRVKIQENEDRKTYQATR